MAYLTPRVLFTEFDVKYGYLGNSSHYKTQLLNKFDVQFIGNPEEVRFKFYLEVGLRINLINFCRHFFVLNLFVLIELFSAIILLNSSSLCYLQQKPGSSIANEVKRHAV